MKNLDVNALKLIDVDYNVLSRNIDFSDVDEVIKFNEFFCGVCDSLIYDIFRNRKVVFFREFDFCSAKFWCFLCDFLLDHGISIDFSLSNVDDKDWINYVLRQNNFRYCVLSKDILDSLFVRYKNGERHLKKVIVEHNIYLVINIAKRKDCNNFSKLISYGIEGLYKAIDNFDVTKNICFSTYAYAWILKYITVGYDNENMPYKVGFSYYRLFKSIMNYIIANDEPDIYHVCEVFGLSYEQFVDLIPIFVGWLNNECKEFVYSSKDCDEICSDYDILRAVNDRLDLEEINRLLSLYSSQSDKMKKRVSMFKDFYLDDKSKRSIARSSGLSRCCVNNSINKVLEYVKSNF